jgi:hypothetical protein
MCMVLLVEASNLFCFACLLLYFRFAAPGFVCVLAGSAFGQKSYGGPNQRLLPVHPRRRQHPPRFSQSQFDLFHGMAHSLLEVF